MEMYGWMREKLEQAREDGHMDRVGKLADYAEAEFGCTVAQLALAWCLKNQNVSTILLGATKEDQLKENLGCISVALSIEKSHMEAIEEILGNKPADWMGPGGTGTRTLHTL